MTINTQLIQLPCRVKALSTSNYDGSYTIIVNSSLCYEMQKESYLHELEHIKENDFDKYDSNVIEYISHKEENYG